MSTWLSSGSSCLLDLKLGCWSFSSLFSAVLCVQLLISELYSDPPSPTYSLFPYPNACCCSDHLCFPSSLLYVDLPFCVYGSHTSAIRLWPFFIVLDIVSSLNNIPHLTPSKSLIKISCESLKLQPCRVFYPGPVHTWHSQQYAIHLSYWFIFCFPSSSLKC